MNSPLDEAISEFQRSSGDDAAQQPAAALVLAGDPGAAEFMRFTLAKRCALVEVVSTIRKAEQLLSRYRFDVLILDNNLPGIAAWIFSWRAQNQTFPLILMSEGETALPLPGARVITKPFSYEQMLDAVEEVLNATTGPTETTRPGHAAGIVSHSEAMQNILATVQVVASRNTTVLLQGESGSGKEVVARCLHQCSGRSGAFVPVNCSAIAPELIESELFGHTRGAFTGAAQARQGLFSYAEGGTLFLDEISELPLAMQSKLLRVLEERTVRPIGQEQEQPINLRIVAATNRNLAEEVAQGRFREDLYYRLNVIMIRLPALRERPSDIPHLTQLFSQQLAHSLDVLPLELDEQEIQRLQGYPWPGNVRELRNVMERAMLLGLYPSECLDPNSLDLSSLSPTHDGIGYPDHLPLAEVERLHSVKVLEIAGGNKSEAARRLGISRKTLERKLKAWEDDG